MEKPAPKKLHPKDRVDQAVLNVKRLVMKRRPDLLDSANPLSYLKLLDPEVAAEALGLSYYTQSYFEGLESFERGRTIAGSLDRQSNTIMVSSKFPAGTQRFTGMHEIGHFLLHPDVVMHRDLPIDGLKLGAGDRDFKEVEANRFAARYLVSEKLLTDLFRMRFGDTPIEVTDDVRFWLGLDEEQAATRNSSNPLQREVAFATARSFCQQHFDSLVDVFGVSVTTMAIRIRELKLVKEWP